MTLPTLPAFIPTARRRHALQLRAQRRRARRKEALEYCILFAFFTIFFAIATIAAFS